MKIEHHIALSTIISWGLYSLCKSWGLSIASFTAGIFIDIDHIIDYLMVYGLRVRPKEFMDYFYKEKHRRITLLFHGWEWLLLLGIGAIASDLNLVLTGAFIGYGHHIVSDYLYSRASIRAYSLIWRWNKGFDSKVIFPRNRGYDPKTNY